MRRDAGSSPSRPGSTGSSRSATSFGARWRPGQTDLDSELQEGALLFGVEVLDVETALASTEADRSETTRLVTHLGVDADRERARFGAWYELFPRSWGGFAGVEQALPELAKLGFDVVYLPPIHPIGVTNRKGRNNALGSRRRTTPAAPGRSGVGRVATRRSIPAWGRSRISPGSSPRAGRTGSRSRSTSRSSARPTTRG